MSITITYFVHGTTTDNENGRATGWLQGELSDLGIQQAKDLGHQSDGRQFDVVFCSDLKRAIDTADLAFGTLHQAIPDERLRECNYGDMDGKEASFKGDLTPQIYEPYPNGESYQDVEKRMASFLQHLEENYDGKHIGIIAHQAPQLALDVLLKGMTWEQAIAQDWRKTKSWQPGWKYILGW